MGDLFDRENRLKKRPHAVVQLRKEDLEGKLLNMVGFQTNLKWSEQKRIFGMIPGLEKAEFVRFGVMHRNTFRISKITFNDIAIYEKEKPFCGGSNNRDGRLCSSCCRRLACGNKCILIS